MKVCAVVVTYNRLNLLQECLRNLNRFDEVSHIVVVDNNSGQETASYLKSVESSKVINVRLEENMGGAGGFYIGLKYFIDETKDDAVWIMDDDTIPNETTLSSLIDAVQLISDSEYGFLVSNARWIDGSPCVMNLPHINLKKWTRLLTNELQIIEVERASFVSILINRKAVLEVGLPIKEFFIWGDDSEYTKRISEKYRSYFVPGSMVLHKMKANTGVDILTDSSNRLDRYFYAFRNNFYIARKTSFKEGLKYQYFIFATLLGLLKRGTTSRFKKINVLVKGAFHGLFFNPRIEKFNSEKE